MTRPGRRGAQPGTLAVSQATSEAVLGIDARRYLQHLREHPEIPRRRVGRLVVTRVSDWLPGADPQASSAPASDEWTPESAIAKAVSR